MDYVLVHIDFPDLALGKNAKEIRSGEIWPDNHGVHINAQGVESCIIMEVLLVW
mgnify:CR=1 FL=1